MANSKRKNRNSRNKAWDKDRDPRSRNKSPEKECGAAGKDIPRSYGGNDISWYSRNPMLLTAAASIPYPYRVGMRLPLVNSGNFRYVGTDGKLYNKNTTVNYYAIPGVCRLNWFPTLGKSTASTDPANIVAREIYARIRSQYSGGLEVDPPDLMMYLGALDSIFAYIAALKRFYRILSVWTPDNYVLPDGLLRALTNYQVDFDEMRAKKTALWQAINELILQTRKFKCPAVMDLFNRHYWLNDNVYTDAPSINSQMYAFSMSYVLTYQEQNSTDASPLMASGLVYHATPWHVPMTPSPDDPYAQPFTVEGLYAFGLQMIKDLNGWDDVFTINGYLQRAFADVPSFAVEEMVQDPVFIPVYNEEVLMQIENARPIDDLYVQQYTQYGVKQNVGANNVVTNDTFSVPTGTSESFANLVNMSLVPPLVNIRSDAPTVADTVIATRLCHSINAVDANTSWTVTLNYATEICHGIYYYDGNGGSAAGVPPVVLRVFQPTGIQQAQTTMPYIFQNVDVFDWHPIYVELVGVGNSTLAMSIHGDTRNVTILEPKQLEDIHRICVLSELNAYGTSIK